MRHELCQGHNKTPSGHSCRAELESFSTFRLSISSGLTLAELRHTCATFFSLDRPIIGDFSHIYLSHLARCAQYSIEIFIE